MSTRLKVFLFCIFSSVSLFSQINIKVGYSFLIPNLSAYNDITEAYNKAQGNKIVEGFGKNRFMNGLELGMRYKFSENFGVEGSWKYGQGNKNEAQINETNGVTTEKWAPKMTAYSIGIISSSGPVGFGVSYDFNSLKLDRFSSTLDKYVRIENDKFNSISTWIQLEAKGNNSSFAIRPTISFPLSSYDFPVSAAQLGVPNPGPSKNMFFGLSLLFFNGPN